MADTPSSSYSSASGDPFSDDRFTRLGDLYNGLDLPPGPPTVAAEVSYTTSGQGLRPSYSHKGMSQSLSEGNIDFRSASAELLANHLNLTKLASNEIPIRYSEDNPISSNSSRFVTSSSSSRGRSFLRSPSPSKLDNDQLPSLSPEKLLNQPPKRSRSPMKQLFGERGWLGRSMSMNELPMVEYRKKSAFKQWGGKLKERVEHLTPEIPRFDISSIASRMQSPSKPKSKSPVKTRFHVSLSPPFQARLYSEMELMIVATANQYLQVQQREGRMSIDSLTRVLETWASKNRPQVIEFLFDQATQRELILHNLRSFRFYGPRAENIISVNSMLQNWKALAREMSVRNFCAPDPMVRKNVLDAFRVLEMLGAPAVTIAAFSEISKKVERLIEEMTQTRRQYEKIKFRTEKTWEPQMSATRGDFQSVCLTGEL